MLGSVAENRGSVAMTSTEKKPKKAKKPKRFPKELYEAELLRLQGELVQMQEWVKATGARLVVIFEGRGAAGKGGAIQRITEFLNPRHARVVALPAPTEREKTQWYFQRYIAHLPAGGEIVILDRSWYNRAGVEKVMGFVDDTDYAEFLDAAPQLERMLVRSGITVLKYWLSISDTEQERRFQRRAADPAKRWKLSPMDLESLDRWDDYTHAKEETFRRTDTDHAPWITIKSNDKKRARLNAMRYFLNQFDYEDKDTSVVYEADPLLVRRGRDAVGD